MTSMRALRDLLMCLASIKAAPDASDFDMRSEPARSTSEILPVDMTRWAEGAEEVSELSKTDLSLTSRSIISTM
jgi:hypothetical protein